MNQPARISYAIMAALLVLIAVLHLGTLLLTAASIAAAGFVGQRAQAAGAIRAGIE